MRSCSLSSSLGLVSQKVTLSPGREDSATNVDSTMIQHYTLHDPDGYTYSQFPITSTIASRRALRVIWKRDWAPRISISQPTWPMGTWGGALIKKQKSRSERSWRTAKLTLTKLGGSTRNSDLRKTILARMGVPGILNLSPFHDYTRAACLNSLETLPRARKPFA